MDAGSKVSSPAGAYMPGVRAAARARVPEPPSYHRVRSRPGNSPPSRGEAASVVRLFCIPHLPKDADRTLETTLIRHSASSADRKCRRIDAASLKAIVRPLAGSFDQMSEQSDYGPYAFAHAMRLTVRTLGAERLESATGELLMHQIPPSSQLSPLAQVQLPGALVHGVGAGIGWGVSAAVRPSPLLVNRLLNPANWYQSADWIASLFRGGVRAVEPGTPGGAARVQALFEHLCDNLSALPPHAIPAVVQGFLDASVQHRFDTDLWGRTLLAHPACTQDALRLAAVGLGLARHYGSPTHAQWAAFDDLVRRAAAQDLPERAFALGCGLGWAARSAPALLAEVRQGCRGGRPASSGAAFARQGVDAAVQAAAPAGATNPPALRARLWTLSHAAATLAGHPPAAVPLGSLAAALDPACRAEALRSLLAVLPVTAMCEWLPVARQSLATEAAADPGDGWRLTGAVLAQACRDLRAAARAQHPESELSLRPFAERLRALARSEMHALSQQPAFAGHLAVQSGLARCVTLCGELLDDPAAEPITAPVSSRGNSRAATPSATPPASPPGSPVRDASGGGRPQGLWDRFARWLAG